jgi:RNA-binding protein
MKRPVTISGKQRRQLRALAHHLEPLVQIGQKGLTDEIYAAVDRALTDHELVKVRIGEGAELDRREVGPALAAKLDAHDVGVIGRVVIVYRRHPEHPKIPLHT